jgi:CheY-like chemotaxis protein
VKVFNNTCEIHAFHAHKKDLELVRWIGPRIATKLLGDPIRLGQILSNLIGNAIKFTQKGEVFVEVKRQVHLKQTETAGRNVLSRQGPVELLFSVTDTGIGIAPEKRETIFEKFAQADSSTTRMYGGTGLGLAISQRLVELMGGKIWVESRVGQGSTFYFTTRFEVQSEDAYSEVPQTDLTGIKALIIDDNATNRRIVSNMLSMWGAEVAEAEDGEKGLAEIRRAEELSDPYPLILLDARMPGVTGFNVLETLKRDARPLGALIIMLTSDDQKAGKEWTQEQSAAGYLFKPVKWSDLKEQVLLALQGEAPERSVEPPIDKAYNPKDMIPLRILLVEDNEKNRLIIKAFLDKTPHSVDVAENGDVGFKKFISGRFDLVLMDIEMPVMDGYTATRKMREWEADNHQEATPIVALTAHALEEHAQRCDEAGCSGHLAKPINKADLLEAISSYAMTDPSGEEAF